MQIKTEVDNLSMLRFDSIYLSYFNVTILPIRKHITSLL